MRILAAFQLFAFLLLALSGCETEVADVPPLSRGNVAVIDLVETTLRLKKNEEIRDLVQKRAAAENEKVAKLRAELQQEFDLRESAAGEPLTDQEARELRTLQLRLDHQVREAVRNGRRKVDVYREQLLEEFRQQVRPIARRAAAERGLSVVLRVKDGTVLAHADAIDITDEVHEAYLARHRSRTQ